MNSTNYDLTKKFRFESAHRLANGYVGKCANIHGHSWNGHITVRCTKLDEMGLGIDFSKIKNEVTKIIEDNYDHKIILCSSDPLIEVLEEHTDLVTTLGNPTSEVIAKAIFDFASSKLNVMLPLTHSTDQYGEAVQDPIKYIFEVIEVVIEETCTSSCKVTKSHAKI